MGKSRLISTLLVVYLIAPAQKAEAWFESSSFANTNEGAKTYMQIDHQNRDQEIGFGNSFQSQIDIDRGRDRAKWVFKALSDAEVKRAGIELKDYGENLKKNPYVQGPAKVIGAGAALWVGQNYNISNDRDFRLVSRLELKSRSTSLDMGSPILNGQLKFVGGDGINVGINRMVPGINSRAEVKYKVSQQAVSTQLSRMLVAHLTLSVGASESPAIGTIEKIARLAYQITL